MAYPTVNEIFVVADKNRDGKITYDEFREWQRTENFR
jgi:Ca2+-binding EF-hand superfamily protein